VRRAPVNAPEQPVKMKSRKTGFKRKDIQIDGRIEMLVDKDLGINDFFIYVGGDRHRLSTNWPEAGSRCGSLKLMFVFQMLVQAYWHNFRGGLLVIDDHSYNTCF
jgi:hypothetical protein